MFGKKLITFILVLLCLIVSTTQVSKSVFIIEQSTFADQVAVYTDNSDSLADFQERKSVS